MNLKQTSLIKTIYKFESVVQQYEQLLIYALDDFNLENKIIKLKEYRRNAKAARDTVLPYYERLYRTLQLSLQSVDEIQSICNANDILYQLDKRATVAFMELYDGKIEKDKSFFSRLHNRNLQSLEVRMKLLDYIKTIIKV